ncbi:NGG1 interacting factor Nif3 [Blastomyces gilchristii SLH14081]|uniref:NGG1 interacting factor Nif3 n=1 Tax=Blastomyces gilchristii (strain SLH14081) TaxID=559298 RepID=A0A179U902_BLAGS|nr:NGG1 interacting factor Nif3 [Blastomyces gilchristii SLH14081]OAT03637.1 NGG1 interacting factor Nif3 [Blastomyces gilchristii SLH14081]
MIQSALRHFSTMTSSNSTSCSPFTRAVVDSMRKLYPECLADKSFDNTGLLLESPFSFTRRQKNSVLLTIDLTKAVANEAIERGDSIIIAYHPIIFRGLKSLTLNDPQQDSLLRLAQNGISVYSPHTAVDAAPGGMADWLLDVALQPKSSPRGTFAPHNRSVIYPEQNPPPGFEAAGMGRIATLKQPGPLKLVIANLMANLDKPDGIPIALPQGKGILEMPDIRTIATCAGSGSSILMKNGKPVADVLVTGEMSHHDALAAIENGAAVVSLFHSDSERGYLSAVMRGKLEEALRGEWDAVRAQEAAALAGSDGERDIRDWLSDSNFTVSVSEMDHDPYEIWTSS